MKRETGADKEQVLVQQTGQGLADSDMGFRIQAIHEGKLDAGYIRVWKQQFQGDKEPMIEPSGLGQIRLYSLVLQAFLELARQLRISGGGVFNGIGLFRETIIVIDEGWVGARGDRWPGLFPMGADDNDGIGSLELSGDQFQCGNQLPVGRIA